MHAAERRRKLRELRRRRADLNGTIQFLEQLHRDKVPNCVPAVVVRSYHLTRPADAAPVCKQGRLLPFRRVG